MGVLFLNMILQFQTDITLSLISSTKCYKIYIFILFRQTKCFVNKTRGMLLLTKAKRPLKFKKLCGFNKHAVKLRMHKAAPYAFRKKPLIHSESIKATIKEI